LNGKKNIEKVKHKENWNVNENTKSIDKTKKEFNGKYFIYIKG
jgi:hypothetical protein